MKYNSQLKYLSFYVIVKYLKYILFKIKTKAGSLFKILTCLYTLKLTQNFLS